MHFNYDEKLSKLISEIEAFLVSNTPRAVAKLKIAEPAYAVFLWYFDSSAGGDFAPEFGVGIESMRSACAKKYDDRSSINDCTWRPQQVIPKTLPRGRFEDRRFIALCNEAYALMEAANQSELPLEDEGELLRPFRSLMHGVAAQLNKFDWSAILKPTAEFAVVSLDMIGNWLTEDLKNSMPKTTLRLLKKRGMIN